MMALNAAMPVAARIKRKNVILEKAVSFSPGPRKTESIAWVATIRTAARTHGEAPPWSSAEPPAHGTWRIAARQVRPADPAPAEDLMGAASSASVLLTFRRTFVESMISTNSMIHSEHIPFIESYLPVNIPPIGG